MIQKLILAAALLMLCAPVMTGCAGGSPQNSSQSDPAVSAGDPQQSASPQGEDYNGIETVENADDLKAASKVLTEFCKGCKKNQNQVLEQYSNVGLVPQFAAVSGSAQNAADTQEMYDNMIASFCRMDKFEISGGALNIAALETYAEYRSEMQEIGAMLREIGASATADAADSLFYPISRIYSFNVDITANGESAPKKMYVIEGKDGGWTVDAGLLQCMVDYMSNAKVDIANKTAETLSKVIVDAVTDLDAEDRGIKNLDGEYHFDGASLTPPSGGEDKTDAEIGLAQKVLSYYENLTHTPHVYFRLDKGELTALAVQLDFRGIPYYGTWPEAVDEHFMYYFSSIDDAMLFAAGEYESAAPF